MLCSCSCSSTLGFMLKKLSKREREKRASHFLSLQDSFSFLVSITSDNARSNRIEQCNSITEHRSVLAVMRKRFPPRVLMNKSGFRSLCLLIQRSVLIKGKIDSFCLFSHSPLRAAHENREKKKGEERERASERKKRRGRPY